MLRSSPEQNRREPTFRLSRILEGAFDADLHTWARGARDFGSEGRDQRKGYGDPGYPDGPERFRDAYRHLIRTMREEGAGNILWVFHANDLDNPQTPWNGLENYYPGDDYIDCLGVSVYGALTPMEEEWPEFRKSMDVVYPRLGSQEYWAGSCGSV